MEGMILNEVLPSTSCNPQAVVLSPRITQLSENHLQPGVVVPDSTPSLIFLFPVKHLDFIGLMNNYFFVSSFLYFK